MFKKNMKSEAYNKITSKEVLIEPYWINTNTPPSLPPLERIPLDSEQNQSQDEVDCVKRQKKALSRKIIRLTRVKIQSFKQFEFFILFLNPLFKPISGIYTMNAAKAQRFWRTLEPPREGLSTM